jgi:hypothetical protein
MTFTVVFPNMMMHFKLDLNRKYFLLCGLITSCTNTPTHNEKRDPSKNATIASLNSRKFYTLIKVFENLNNWKLKIDHSLNNHRVNKAKEVHNRKCVIYFEFIKIKWRRRTTVWFRHLSKWHLTLRLFLFFSFSPPGNCKPKSKVTNNIP